MSESLPLPPKTEGRGPTLSTIHEVEQILRDAEGPLSLNEIKRRMSAKAVRHRTVRQVIDEFKRLGFVAEGSKGVIWTLNLSPELWTKGRVVRL
ncbi:hypothetical protein AKJ47_00075 [candidate division MSBL1 archaeon SCGC-AAA261G05]|uniref:Helix-turn-helix type 11 domain-containing protein n=2 Tax=candidate division MSBL1 TaxID=215777 RepID=A0A133VCU0_9EURY|nr:hypothetical protein AKJ47_00075 [candidate division MSBL1 archaeon SCGC-AAA261G05]KXB05105.1 hypothetical protein AKJ48_00100 [candidate division MSBL1 archaeon SCGC-AAA261O19]